MRFLLLGDSVYIVFRDGKAYAPHQRDIHMYASRENAERYWECDDHDIIVEYAPVPPNIPLSLKKMTSMEGEPVYDSIDGIWYVISFIEDSVVYMTDGTTFDGSNEENKTEKRFYRRKPKPKKNNRTPFQTGGDLTRLENIDIDQYRV